MAQSGRATSITNPLGHSLNFNYDDNDNLTVITTPVGIVAYEYDANNRLTLTTDPNMLTTSYEYDEIGNLVQVVDDVGIGVARL